MSEYKQLGQYIQQIDIRNSDLKIEHLLGVSVEKKFIESIANTIGTDFSKYKIVKKGQFTYIPDTSRRGDKIGIALLTDFDQGLVSNIYTVFEVIDKTKLLPEYLMLWFSRPEFDRYARFKSHGSVREIFDWDEMCRVELPIPDISIQKQIIDIYNYINKELSLKEKIYSNIEKQIQIEYKKWFIDLEPFNGEIPNNWRKAKLSDLLILQKDTIQAGKNKNLPYLPIDCIPMHSLLLRETRPNEEAQSSLITFNENNILIGAMRVYFHRVLLSPINGITRSTCFVLTPKIKEYLYYSLLLCYQDSTISYANQTSQGTTMPYAVWENGLADLEILIPDIDTINNFNQATGKLIELLKNGFFDISNLLSINTNLVPSLLSIIK